MKKIVTVFVLLGLLSACAGVTNTDVGTLSGAAVGGLVGSRFGGGTGRVLATAGGAMAGALIGNRIGGYMDKVDQMEMNRALEVSADNQSKKWTNPNTGNQYVVEPTRTYYQGSQPCREYTTKAIIGGKTEQVYGKACRTADGSWQIIS